MLSVSILRVRQYKKVIIWTGLALLLLSVISFLIISWWQKTASAAPNDVVINEIMYHPQSDDNDDEYIELYNRTASIIDLNGWCFTDGIDLCFTAGQTIAANGYLIVSPNNAKTNTTYGVTPPYGQYTGSLSNSGENIELRNNTNDVVTSVHYEDHSPWSITPDELGPSLELNDPDGDINDPYNWGASIGNPTPNVQNSIHKSGTPVIKNVTDPNNVAANTAVPITANITGSGIISVNLHYKLNFDADITLTMYDDGAHNDGGSGDNVYGASIPGQAIKNLVRFKIEAVNGSGTTTSPRYDDTQSYHGYYVKDPSVTSSAEILEWFISDSNYSTMQTNFISDAQYDTVIVYGNDVYDNSLIRVKGNNSRYFIKKSYKIELPKGYRLQVNGTDRAIDEFHLNANYANQEAGKVPALWWAAKQIGLDVPDNAITRLQKNGEFYGLYMLIDKYGNDWRKDKDYDTNNLYDSYYFSNPSHQVWKDHMISDPIDPTTRGYVLDENNIPSLMNTLSAVVATQSHDQWDAQNTFFYFNSKTERWSTLLWDFDLSMNLWGPQTLVSPYEEPYASLDNRRFYMAGFYNQPDLRQAYLRRLRTVIDMLYSNDALLNKYNELSTLYATENNLDVTKWPDAGGQTRLPKTKDLQSISHTKTLLTVYLRKNYAIPPAQTNAERQQVSFNQVAANTNNANEYIKLDNAANTPVDISGWQIEGLSYTIPEGAVIPANGSIYLLRDDIGYKAAHSSVLVAGQYAVDLNDITGTNLILKTDTGMNIDSWQL